MNIQINTPAELENFINALNAPLIKESHAKATELMDTLERRMADLRSSIERAKLNNTTVDIECEIGNLCSHAIGGLAKMPKKVDAFSAYRAVRDLEKA